MPETSGNDNFAFEDSLQKLENIVETLEAGDLSLEDSLKAFEDGIALTRQCQDALSKAEHRVKILMEKNGAEETLDFDNDNHAT